MQVGDEVVAEVQRVDVGKDVQLDYWEFLEVAARLAVFPALLRLPFCLHYFY